MNKYVLDASAVLALIFLETGWQKVDNLLERSSISTINVAEALTKLVQDDISVEKASEQLFRLNMRIVDYDIKQAITTAELRPLTKHLGLSLGDRACLALAIQEKATAVTADKNWATLDVCRVEVIR